MHLDVLTLNLWNANPPFDRRVELLVGWLREHRFDLIGLQEVAPLAGRGSVAHLLAEACAYEHVHHLNSGLGRGRGEGLAVLTDLDSDALEPVALPHGDDAHRRACQLVDVVVDGTAVRVANTHIAYRLHVGDLRAEQTRAIRAALAGWTGPLVLTGDLNDRPDSDAVRVLTEPAEGWDPLTDTYAAAGRDERATFDSANEYVAHPHLAGRRIDHVLARGFDVADADVVLDGSDGPVVTDHYGVRARLIG